MANRLALRDLQLRLAQRLEQSAETSAAGGWLAVEVGDKGFLLPLAQSGEIFSWAGIQAVPYTQDWFAGVVNLRGGLYGVVDLHLFLYAEPAPGRNQVNLSQCRFVGFNHALEINCVLLVDRLAGLRGVQDFASRVQTDDQVRPGFFGTELVDHQGRVWQEVDLQKLASDAHFLKVAVNTEAVS